MDGGLTVIRPCSSPLRRRGAYPLPKTAFLRFESEALMREARRTAALGLLPTLCDSAGIAWRRRPAFCCAASIQRKPMTSLLRAEGGPGRALLALSTRDAAGCGSAGLPTQSEAVAGRSLCSLFARERRSAFAGIPLAPAPPSQGRRASYGSRPTGNCTGEPASLASGDLRDWLSGGGSALLCAAARNSPQRCCGIWRL
jgi:hypothetical protein